MKISDQDVHKKNFQREFEENSIMTNSNSWALP